LDGGWGWWLVVKTTQPQVVCISALILPYF